MTDMQIWLCDLTYTQQTVAADTMPMAIGCIAEYTEKRLGLTTPIVLFKYPEDLIEALETGPLPQILGFSNYCWNLGLSSDIARAVKDVAPHTVIVFGGPNYPLPDEERVTFLLEHPEIDFYLAGEGEAAFADLVEALRINRFDTKTVKQSALPSIHCLDADGGGSFPPKRDRLVELDEIPSPYTSGRLDKFFDGKLMPLLQTNRGCPFSCTFCVEGDTYYSKIRKYSAERIRADVDYIGSHMHAIRSDRSRNDLFIADSNFGMYAGDIDTCQALRKTREDYQWPEYINVATGKNSKERVIEAAELLDGALRLSGSVQSLDANVLTNIRRKNISVEQLVELGLHSNRIGVNSYSEIILGLPGDSKVAHYDTIRQVIDAGFNIVLPWQLMLINGSELATRTHKQLYQMDVRYRILPRCFGSYPLFGKTINSAEIEEVCVANATLPFEDYLECRRLNLFVAIFYNDSIFSGLLKLFRLLDISIFDWILRVMEHSRQTSLEGVVTEFLQATRDELWSSRAELEAFCRDTETIQRYVRGELGRNNLYYFRTLAITQHIDTLKSMALNTALAMLQEADQDDAELRRFVGELLEYHALRIRDVFTEPDRALTGTFNFDLLRFDKDNTVTSYASVRADHPRTYHFTLNEQQRDLIRRNLIVHGSNSVGIARILSRVFVKKLYRQVEEV
ncbi:MAG: hypothetical protein PHD37_10210 [Gallionellaceae bacterium]|nr:hypothetical protein [Gallionellaceae bacterium]